MQIYDYFKSFQIFVRLSVLKSSIATNSILNANWLLNEKEQSYKTDENLYNPVINPEF